MKDIAAMFMRFKVQNYRANKWIFLYCDNLRAHLADDMKKIFGDAKVFLYHLSPNITHFTEPIDTKLNRSTCIAVGNELDI